MINPKINITSEILKLIAQIDEFKGQWCITNPLRPEKLKRLKKVATIESIGSSTRIEGSKLSDEEVEKLLAGLSRQSFQTRDEQEVAGYAEVMEIIFDAYGEIPLTENYIKQLHGILLKHSAKDIHHRGEYKKITNHVEAFDAEGRSLGVIFATASPFETPLRMQELVAWARQSFQDNKEHSLLIIATFILHFLTIHPFEDGNGRLSRILTTALFLQNGYLYVPYSSMEHIIEENKDQYYLALRRSQKQLGTAEEDPTDWLVFFLNAMKNQIQVLKKKIEQEKKLIQMPSLDEAILNLAKEQGRITNAIIQLATGANRNTIKMHLQKLMKERLLVKEGTGKGSWYQRR